MYDFHNSIEHVDLKHVPLCITQERTLLTRELLRRRGVTFPPNVCSFGVRIAGRLNLIRLEAVLNTILRRHPALRSRLFQNIAVSKEEWESRLQHFASTGLFASGLYIQSADEDASLELQQYDLTTARVASRLRAIQDILQSEVQRPFDYQRPPLMRVLLVTLGADEYVLFALIDHLISDGISIEIILNELTTLYAQFDPCCPGTAVDAPAVSYHDYAAWQSDMASSAYFDEDIAFWRRRWSEYAGDRIAFTHLPFSLPVTDIQTFDIACERVTVGEERWRLIRSFARQHSITLYVLCLTAFSILLHRYTGKTRVALWTHCGNRIRKEIFKTVGCFVNTHLLGLELRRDQQVKALLSQARAVVVDAMAHQEMPVHHLWNVSGCAPRFADSTPLLTCRVRSKICPPPHQSSDNVHMQTISLPEVSSPRFSSCGIYIGDYQDYGSITLRYLQARFPLTAMSRMLRDFENVLVEIAVNPSRSLASVSSSAAHYAVRVHGPEGMDECLAHKSPMIRVREPDPIQWAVGLS